MLYSHLGRYIFISIQANVGQIYVHYIELKHCIKGCLKRGRGEDRKSRSIKVRFCAKCAYFKTVKPCLFLLSIVGCETLKVFASVLRQVTSFDGCLEALKAFD
jgi:hypothetical protein